MRFSAEISGTSGKPSICGRGKGASYRSCKASFGTPTETFRKFQPKVPKRAEPEIGRPKDRIRGHYTQTSKLCGSGKKRKNKIEAHYNLTQIYCNSKILAVAFCYKKDQDHVIIFFGAT